MNIKELIKLNPVILDTETTGLGDKAEIVTIGIIDMAGHILLDEMIKPTIEIPAGATKIHGITNKMVANKKSYADIAFIVNNVLEGRHVAIYNADYDIPVLAHTAKMYGIDMVELASVTCILKMYAEFFGDWNDWHKSYRWQKLGDAVEQCQLKKPDNLHNALTDCEMTRQVMLHMADNPL